MVLLLDIQDKDHLSTTTNSNMMPLDVFLVILLHHILQEEEEVLADHLHLVDLLITVMMTEEGTILHLLVDTIIVEDRQ
jgi:hypothetical protein